MARSDLAQELLHATAELGSQHRTADPFAGQKYLIPPEQFPAWVWLDTAHLQNKLNQISASAVLPAACF